MLVSRLTKLLVYMSFHYYYAYDVLAKQENLTNPWYLPVQLLSDGIPVENSENLNLTIYSDPAIEVSMSRAGNVPYPID